MHSLSAQVREPDFFVVPKGYTPKEHSKLLDKNLGYKVGRVEQGLLKKYRAFWKRADDGEKKKHFHGTETWIGLHPQVLQTPYSEIMNFLSLFKNNPPRKIVDFGAGYGRIGVVMNSLYPRCDFLGYEILEARIEEGKRIYETLKMDNCEIIHQNILEKDFVIPKADIYFIYDFSDPLDLRIILDKLSAKMPKDRFYIVAKGEGVRSLIQNKYPEFWVCDDPIHRKNWSLYKAN